MQTCQAHCEKRRTAFTGSGDQRRVRKGQTVQETSRVALLEEVQEVQNFHEETKVHELMARLKLLEAELERKEEALNEREVKVERRECRLEQQHLEAEEKLKELYQREAKQAQSECRLQQESRELEERKRDLGVKEQKLNDQEMAFMQRHSELQQKTKELEEDRWALEHSSHQRDIVFNAKAAEYREVETMCLQVMHREADLENRLANQRGILRSREKEIEAKCLQVMQQEADLDNRTASKEIMLRRQEEEVENRRVEVVQKEARLLELAAREIGNSWADWTQRSQVAPSTFQVCGGGNKAPKDAFDVEFSIAEAHFHRMMSMSASDSRPRILPMGLLSLPEFGECNQFEITKVDIVQIPMARAAFLQRASQELHRLGREPQIKYGFHGTDEEGLAGILQHGFKVQHPKTGKNGLVYGSGIYLATRPKLAMRFVRLHPRRMVLAEYIDVPENNHHRVNEDGGAVVIPHENLVYPKYIVHFNGRG